MKPQPWTLIDPVQNVLARVADCLPFEGAVTVWESALRQGLVRREKLERLPYTPRALKVLQECTLYSDSGLESYVRIRCQRLRVRVLPQVYIEGHHVDFLIGDRLVLQIDGATHTGAQRTSDIAHDANLMTLGYRVIRVGYEQVMHRWPDVFEMLLEAISQGLHQQLS